MKRNKCQNTHTHRHRTMEMISENFCPKKAIKWPFKTHLSLDSLKMVYYSYLHSLMTYGLIFWENSHHINTIFRLQNKIISIIVGIRGRDSCREHFKNLKILQLKSQSILSLLFFVIVNVYYFKVNSSDTRHQYYE